MNHPLEAWPWQPSISISTEKPVFIMFITVESSISMEPRVIMCETEEQVLFVAGRPNTIINRIYRLGISGKASEYHVEFTNRIVLVADPDATP